MFSYSIYQDFQMHFTDIKPLDRQGVLFKHTQYGYGWHVDFLAKELIVEPTFLYKKSVLKPDAYHQSHRSLRDDDGWEEKFGSLGGGWSDAAPVYLEADDHVDVFGTLCFHYDTPLELTNANFGTLWNMSRDGKLLVEGHEPIVGECEMVSVTVHANKVLVYEDEN
jgi:hypothetical protein